MAGAPTGNQNASRGKRFASKLEKRIEDLKAMDGIVDALITKALDGDLSAIKEVADRLDGKSKQQVDLGGQNGENPLVTAINIRFVKSSESPADGD